MHKNKSPILRIEKIMGIYIHTYTYSVVFISNVENKLNDMKREELWYILTVHYMQELKNILKE